MYDPSIGRWMTEDPKGFAAGDANLDRYAGNNPTNETDPSGLEPPTIWDQLKEAGKEIGEKAWESLGKEWEALLARDNIPTASFMGITRSYTGFTNKERKEVDDALHETFVKLEKARIAAKYWLELRAAGIGTTAIPGGKPFTHRRVRWLDAKPGPPKQNSVERTALAVRQLLDQSLPGYVAYWWRLDRVTKELKDRDNVLKFRRDKSADKRGDDTQAYVPDAPYSLGVILGDKLTTPTETIYIKTEFFKPGTDKVYALTRELGRRIGFSETGTGTMLYDADEWNNTVTTLAGLYDEMVAKGVKLPLRVRPRVE